MNLPTFVGTTIIYVFIKRYVPVRRDKVPGNTDGERRRSFIPIPIDEPPYAAKGNIDI